ncbi:hypothetical protein HN859_01930 [Candidatus Parcubacteria bacterium]|jgi:hypothetical protein|nr:hypothetical protein [Candidatus Parcubacteria bacterium]
MPYIKQKDRDSLDLAIINLANLIKPEHRAGELNYIITKLLLLTKGDGKYKDFNELVGMLECCKQEFYRQQIAPYEDQKIKENGNVK